MKKLLTALLIIAGLTMRAQTCDCGKEFSAIRSFIEKNYAGFSDKQKQMTRTGYLKMTSKYEKLANKTGTGESCLLVITQYLDAFRDHHIQVQGNFGQTVDMAYVDKRPVITISDAQLERLKKSTGIEGIYNSRFDTSYTIAVMKDPTELHDYVAVMLQSKMGHWKKGLVKWEAKKINDSLLRGVLYMRNHLPKPEGLWIGKNRIGGDWQRVGTQSETFVSEPYKPVSSRKLSEKTLYISIASFSPSNAHNIDSVFKAREAELKTMPYLVLDLRNNGGGSDFAYSPILPYVYTRPIKNIGVDVLATEANINGWEAILKEDDIPEDTKKSISNMVGSMKANKDKWVNIVDDDVDSSFAPIANPRKIVVLINEGCASTTEQFLLAARQSSKVILAGKATDGTLDYSNMRETSFPCLPYKLMYATTRSRRLDVGQGIDEEGIKPNVVLKENTDWVAAAVKMLEK